MLISVLIVLAPVLCRDDRVNCFSASPAVVLRPRKEQEPRSFDCSGSDGDFS